MSFDFGNANEAQREAIISTEGPLLIIAGPGTGKTFTLVKRIVYLITEKNVKPEEILVATFTEKAAKELVTRITNELLKIGVTVNINEMYVGTFHSICLRIIKEHLEFTRVKKNYRMLDQFDQKYLIFQHINRFRNLDHYKDIFSTNKGVWWQAGEIASYIVKTKDGEVWIIETKGGEVGGHSKNIDVQVGNKFRAFKRYAGAHKLKWGFVRDIDEELFINNTEYVEDMSDPSWRPLSDEL